MSDYILTKIDGLATEYTVEPDNNDLYVMEHIVSGQTCKMKHSTLRSFFLSTSTASTINANSTWNDNKYIRIGTDADFQMYFDGTNFQMKNVTSNSDIIISQSPGGVLTEILRFLGTTGNLKVPTTTYFSNSGAAATGLHFTATEVHCTQLFQCESKLKIQNNMICGANYINYSGNSSAGLNFDSNEYGYFTNRLYANDLFFAMSKIYAKSNISENGTGGLTFTGANATQTGTLVVTDYIQANNGIRMFGGKVSQDGTGGMAWDASGNATNTGTLTGTGKVSSSTANVEAKTKFTINGVDGTTVTRVVAVGQTVTVVGGIITSWPA